MSDERKFECNYCDDPCVLIVYSMGARDDENITPVACPYDGTIVNYWKEVIE